MTNRITSALAGVAFVALVLSIIPDLSAYAWPLWGISLVFTIAAGVSYYLDKENRQ